MSLFTPLRRSLHYQTSSLARCLEVIYRNTAFRVTACQSHQNFHVVQGRPNYYLSLTHQWVSESLGLFRNALTFWAKLVLLHSLLLEIAKMSLVLKYMVCCSIPKGAVMLTINLQETAGRAWDVMYSIFIMLWPKGASGHFTSGNFSL